MGKSGTLAAAGCRVALHFGRSLAVSYRTGELNVFDYHAFNLAVHLLAAVALFGVVRRTLTWLACPAISG